MSIHRYKKTEVQERWCAECNAPHTKTNGYWCFFQQVNEQAFYICDTCLAKAKKYQFITNGEPTHPDLAKRKQPGPA